MSKPSSFDSVAKRVRLPSAKNPRWQGVSGGRGGVSLGYRKPARGPGTWIVKLVIDGNRVEQRLAQADDPGSDPDALSYPAAVTAAIDWARAQVRRLDGEGEGADAEVPTVRTAVEAYVATRSERAPTAGKDAEKRLGKHVLSDQAFAETQLAKLNASTIRTWRQRLSSELQPTTVNRLLNDLRAALNAAAEHHRRVLPATLAAEIRAGTKANSAGSSARKQVLPDAEIRRLVDAAFAVDETGDFGRLVLVMAATGARHSQVARITVGDVQVARGRIMVPPSNKGRAGKRPTPIAVPVGADVIERLQVALAGRRGHEPLLLHWRHRQVGPVTWERVDRGPWATASAALRLWDRARTRAEGAMQDFR